MGALIEVFTLTISYPLRLMATYLTTAILKLFGYAVSAEQTQIDFQQGTAVLAVTDACSGIDQLFGLIIVAGAFAWMMQKKWLFRAFHFMMVLPSLVIANTVRLVLTVVLLDRYGNVILENAWHRGLGWFQVLLTVTLVWAFGKLIQLASE